MEDQSGRLMLLDAPSMYFRAFHGLPDITAPDGTPVNAVRGMLDYVTTLVRTHRPTHMVACMDADWRPAWRVAAVPTYKAHRVAQDGGDPTPGALQVQVPIISELLEAVGIAWLGVNGYEADDAIGTLAASSRRPVDVVTGDRDLFQTVDDARGVRVLYIARGVGRLQIFDEAAVEKKYHIPGTAYAEFALLRGDPSDGLPGAVGIGEKTAAQLIRRFGTVAQVIDAADEPTSSISPGVRRNVLSSRAYLHTADPVVRVATDVDLPPINATLPHEPVDPDALEALAARTGLGRAIDRVLMALSTVQSSTSDHVAPPEPGPPEPAPQQPSPSSTPGPAA